MAKIEQAGLHIHPSRGEDRLIIGVIGDKKAISALEMNMMEGVEKTVRITEKYKLVSRDFHPANTIVDVAGFPVGGEQLAIMAGPCSVESYDQLYEIAVAVRAAGAAGGEASGSDGAGQSGGGNRSGRVAAIRGPGASRTVEGAIKWGTASPPVRMGCMGASPCTPRVGPAAASSHPIAATPVE